MGRVKGETMERLEIDQAMVDQLREELRRALPEFEEPLPGSVVKQDDDILWLGFAPGRVVWGSDAPDYVYFFSPDIFSPNSCACVPAEYITDRAPVDPSEAPLPIYPDDGGEEQAQQASPDGNERQMGGERRRARREYSIQQAREAVAAVLAALPSDDARAFARERIRAKRPELLDHAQAHELGDHRHDAIPPGPHKGER